MMLDSDSIPIYLYFGYLPIVAPLPFVGSVHTTHSGGCHVGQAPPDELTDVGVDILRHAFRETIQQADPDGRHVLPLSGGLDSRAILGGLLENLPSRQIQAVTFGSPGMWDYEIGRDVARAAGVRWTAIDLSSEQWVWDTAALVETAKQLERPIRLFDTHVNRQVPARLGPEPVYWSGFMGDPLSGSHLLRRDSLTWGQAQRRFAGRNRFAHSVNLAPPGFAPQHGLPPAPLLDSEILCYDEQLDFAIRQECLIRHIVLPRGYNYRTPFLHPAWASFILSVPRRYRQGQRLYKEILKAAYPRLFSLPVKGNFGLPLDASFGKEQTRILGVGLRGLARRIAPNFCYSLPPGRSYMDFDRAIRQREDLRQVIGENLQDLKKRRLIDWLDPEDIWRRHQRGRRNHADALMLLASLEIHLKVQDKAPRIDYG